MNMTALPKGIWYEEAKRRYRVRRYHNKVVYGPYYYRTLEAAMTRFEALNEELALIPKEDRPRRKLISQGE